MQQFFVLYSNCIPVKGNRRSIICDLQNAKYSFIPNHLYDILTESKEKSITEIIDYYGRENEETIQSYFRYLDEHRYVYFTDDKSLLNYFPPLSLDWDFPSTITNAIIDFDARSENTALLPKIAAQLDQLNCKYIQLRFFDQVTIDILEHLLKAFSDSGVMSIEIVAPYNEEFTDLNIDRLLTEQRLLKLVIYGSPFERAIRPDLSIADIYFIQTNIQSEKDCGKVSVDAFACNVKLFSESQHFNSCLNRKVGIDSRGNIKNCPSMNRTFGNVAETDIAEAISDPAFSGIWHITKDQIRQCKDCEFRYICTDCRAYIEDPDDILSKPLKCGYNSNTCTWEDWSTNPLKNESARFYDVL